MTRFLLISRDWNGAKLEEKQGEQVSSFPLGLPVIEPWKRPAIGATPRWTCICGIRDHNTSLTGCGGHWLLKQREMSRHAQWLAATSHVEWT